MTRSTTGFCRGARGDADLVDPYPFDATREVLTAHARDIVAVDFFLASRNRRTGKVSVNQPSLPPRPARQAGLTPTDVTLVNTPPPDMTVALLAKGIDAFSAWDPWPIVAQKDVPGAFEVIRGGEVIGFLGFNVALRSWVAQNQDTVERFLIAVSEADKWMRANPKPAAQVAVRWILGLKPDVAEAAMQYNIQAGRPPCVRSQLPRAVGRAGPASPARADQVHLRREQAR